jgi:purine nucleosidase
MARDVIIDTDGGVDDAVALWSAVTDPTLNVLAVTVVWGNVSVEIATRSVARVLEAAGRGDIPIAVGVSGPIATAPDIAPAGFIHGDDGLGNTTAGLPPPGVSAVDEPAVSLLARVCRAAPGRVSLVTLGPLSNIGALLRDDPDVASTVDELVMMGGSARYGGNATPNGEANIAHDPAAAALVVAAAWEQPPLMVGLDVTQVARFGPAEFGLLAEHRSDAAAFLDDPLRFYLHAYGRESCPCHDLLAVRAFADPAVISDAPLLPLAIDDAGGPSWGATVVDTRGHGVEEGFYPWRIALGVDVTRFLATTRAMFGAGGG